MTSPKKPFARIHQRVKSADITNGELRLYYELALMVDKVTGECTVSRSRLMAECKVASVRTIDNWLEALKAKKLVTFAKTGGRKARTYSLVAISQPCNGLQGSTVQSDDTTVQSDDTQPCNLTTPTVQSDDNPTVYIQSITRRRNQSDDGIPPGLDDSAGTQDPDKYERARKALNSQMSGIVKGYIELGVVAKWPSVVDQHSVEDLVDFSRWCGWKDPGGPFISQRRVRAAGGGKAMLDALEEFYPAYIAERQHHTNPPWRQNGQEQKPESLEDLRARYSSTIGRPGTA